MFRAADDSAADASARRTFPRVRSTRVKNKVRVRVRARVRVRVELVVRVRPRVGVRDRVEFCSITRALRHSRAPRSVRKHLVR